ncbi:MAG TPA: hypothetical protein PKY78_04975 [Candidatus Omnitrophota bacterium]|nr:hypothetical protein [Candidatus Omnitrophota bacterium]
MKKVLSVLLLLVLASSFAYAADEATPGDAVKAVAAAPFVVTGKVLSVMAGEKENSVTVENESGETKIFPIDQTAQIVDASLNVATLGALKSGDKVKVEGTKAGDKETVKSVTVQK